MFKIDIKAQKKNIKYYPQPLKMSWYSMLISDKIDSLELKDGHFLQIKTSLKNDIIILGLTVLGIKSNRYVELKR